ncbi:uncharacterized protein LOC143374078 [Andrena cerasifolii]|uniref:uncharacterized protein LOC143374078 n=1 Tax=Andrena cerasifolii TaxID=2819439 RepID=UPI0040380950
MWIIYVALAAAWNGSVLAFPQNDFSPDDFSSESRSEIFEADGFIFNGPASKPLSRITTSTTQETVSPSITMRPATVTTTTTTMTTTTTAAPDPQRDACVKRCPVTLEYNPVCGTDNQAYDNPGLLNCAATCGKDVKLSYPGICLTNNMRG